MGNANMSDKSSQPDNSDDLIAQLAQLMADDAQSGRDENPSPEDVSEPVIALDSTNLGANNAETENSISESEHSLASYAPTITTSHDPDPIADLISSQLENNDGSKTIDSQQTEISSNEQTPDEILPNDDTADNFNVPPVFGLGDNNIKTSDIPENNESLNIATQENATSYISELDMNEPKTDDPIVDIENLIGEAVKAGMPSGYEDPNNEPSQKAQQDPQIDDINSAAKAAEEAIMAATADTDFINEEGMQTEVGNELNIGINSSNFEQENISENDVYSKPKKSFISSLFGPAIAGVALLAVGFGLFWFFDSKRTQNSTIPVLNATNEPQKIVPAKTNENVSNSEQSVVFNEISGETKINENEQIVSRDESITENSNPVTRVIPTDASSDDSNLANIRVVRTVTVRPDGTILNGDSARAGTSSLPVDRPNVPELPENSVVDVPQTSVIASAEQPSSPVVEPQISAPIDPAIKAPIPFVKPANLKLINPAPSLPVVSTPVVPTPVVPTPVVSTPVVNSNAAAVDLIASNANQAVAPIVNSVPATPAPATAAPAIAAPATPALTSSNAPAYVQLSSQRAEQTARASLNSFKNKYSAILGSNQLEIQRADLGDKGIYYRVRLPANSINSANQICANIKQAGGECFVRTN